MDVLGLHTLQRVSNFNMQFIQTKIGHIFYLSNVFYKAGTNPYNSGARLQPGGLNATEYFTGCQADFSINI